MTGQEVKRIRESLGLSQRQFAERLGVHKVTVAKWETDAQGMRGPAERLIRLLGDSNTVAKKARSARQGKRPKAGRSRTKR